MMFFSMDHWDFTWFFLIPIVIAILLIGQQKTILIRHDNSGLIKKGYYGWSWTYFLFGWFVPVFRGEIGIAAIHFVFTCITFGFFQIFMSFFYNKQYMIRMLTSGWTLYNLDKDTEEKIRQALRISK
jgi:hypothetical protein